MQGELKGDHAAVQSAVGCSGAVAMTTNYDEGDLLLSVSGIIPADEFHPFVVQTARRVGLRGWVQHHAYGALVRAVGTEEQLVQLIRAIRDHAPASSRVRSMDPEVVTAETPPVSDGFVALGEDLGEHHDPAPDHSPPLARVA